MPSRNQNDCLSRRREVRLLVTILHADTVMITAWAPLGSLSFPCSRPHGRAIARRVVTLGENQGKTGGGKYDRISRLMRTQCYARALAMFGKGVSGARPIARKLTGVDCGQIGLPHVTHAPAAPWDSGRRLCSERWLCGSGRQAAHETIAGRFREFPILRPSERQSSPAFRSGFSV